MKGPVLSRTWQPCEYYTEKMFYIKALAAGKKQEKNTENFRTNTPDVYYAEYFRRNNLLEKLGGGRSG